MTPSQVGAPWRSWEGRYLRFESDGKVAEDSSTADSPRLDALHLAPVDYLSLYVPVCISCTVCHWFAS